MHRLEAAQRAAHMYAVHAPTCGLMHKDQPDACTCGLDAALRKAGLR